MALRQLIDETHSNDGQHLGHHELDRLQHSTHVMLTRGVENTVQLMRVRRANRFVRQQRQHEADRIRIQPNETALEMETEIDPRGGFVLVLRW